MNKIKKSLAIATLAIFTSTTASVLVPAHALAAPYRPYPHPVHRSQGHNNLSKTGKALLIIGSAVGITSLIIGSAKHRKKNKPYQYNQG